VHQITKPALRRLFYLVNLADENMPFDKQRSCLDGLQVAPQG